MWGQWRSRVTWMKQRIGRWQQSPAGADSQALAQYYLGRGRRAREAGRPDQGIVEARRAVALAPRNPWAYALLGQCLLRAAARDPRWLVEAAQALERARRLAPTNGYFVRLALEVAHARRDARARAEILHRAWWAGAPVERWLPDGPPQPKLQHGQAAGILNPVDRLDVDLPQPAPPAVAATPGAHPVPA
jgi:tetratricopeptide (TPR) repeat protein